MEVRSVRTDEIRLTKEDIPAPWVRYYGRSDSFLAADADRIWQIMRTVKEGTITTTTYANKGSFTAQWNLRSSYFPSVTVSYAAFGQSMAIDFTSDTIVNVGGGISLQLIWTGNNAANGAVKIETSVDGTCWCDYPNGDFTIPLVAGCQPFDLPESESPFFRVTYLKGGNTSGTLDIAYSAPGGLNGRL